MSTDIISNNPIKNHQCLNNSESLLEASVDELDYLEAKHYCWEQEVEVAIACAKELLKMDSQPGLNNDGTPTYLARECSLYLENQYKEACKGKIGISYVPQIKEDLRATSEQNFLNFVRTKIWDHLKTNNLISEPWAQIDSYNNTSNAIFGSIQADLYRFAAEVFDCTPDYVVGY